MHIFLFNFLISGTLS